MTKPGRINIQKNIPLAPSTTLGIGGPARYFTKIEADQQLEQAFHYAEANGLEVFILGGGSNILVSDRGFDGVVIQIAPKGIRSVSPAVAGGLIPTYDKPANKGRNAMERASAKPDDKHQPPPSAGGSDTILISAAAGEDWDQFVANCVSENLAGVECLSGIPGFVGGTPVQNVGAYGQEVSETIVSVRCFDRLEKKFVELSNADCGFSYRKSIFNTTARDRYVVLEVRYALIRGGRPKIVYKDLIEIFGPREPTLAEVRDAVLKIRRAKSMVIDPTDPNSRSAGSFFKNPIVENGVLEKIAAAANAETAPHFPVDEDSVKVPAAWLIEQAGFYKGIRLGNAGISSKHSLALINLGGATAAEIIALMELIQSRVDDKFGIRLQPEPVFIGFLKYEDVPQKT